jgi:hypothetical protein
MSFRLLRDQSMRQRGRGVWPVALESYTFRRRAAYMLRAFVPRASVLTVLDAWMARPSLERRMM